MAGHSFHLSRFRRIRFYLIDFIDEHGQQFANMLQAMATWGSVSALTFHLFNLVGKVGS